MLYTVFCQQAAAGELNTIGICFNAPVFPPGKTDKIDAICLQLEHRQSESIIVVARQKIEHGRQARNGPEQSFDSLLSLRTSG